MSYYNGERIDEPNEQDYALQKKPAAMPNDQRKEERPWWREEFRKELKEQYRGILPDEILDKGNPWFEAFISRVLAEERRRAAERVRGMKRPISGTGFKAEREIGIDTDTYDNGYNHGIDAAAKSLEASEKVDNQ